MKPRTFLFVFLGLLLGAALLYAAATAQAPAQASIIKAPDNKPDISPKAENVMRSACQFLQDTHTFCMSAEIWHDHVNSSGQKVQFSRSLTMDVRRPDRFHIELCSPHGGRAFWYDGKELTVLDRKHNFYSSADMPETLDKVFEASREELGIDLPLIDLAVSDPYQNAFAQVKTGRYFGISPVLGIPCHHLAFTQDTIDWQVWIEDGPQPLIRKLLITHKNDPGSPEFTAIITRWELDKRIAESDFVFEKPMGATKIDMKMNEQGGVK